MFRMLFLSSDTLHRVNHSLFEYLTQKDEVCLFLIFREECLSGPNRCTAARKLPWTSLPSMSRDISAEPTQNLRVYEKRRDLANL